MQRAPNGTTAECRGRGSAWQPAGLSSGSSQDFSQAEPSTPLCRLRGCHLESMFSNDVIVQCLKGKSKNPMKVGTPSGPGKVDCLATSTYCSSQLFLSVASISPDKSVWIFFLTHLKCKQTNEKDSKMWRCLVNRMHFNSYGSMPKIKIVILHVPLCVTI